MGDDAKLWIQRDLQELAKAAALEAIQSQGGLALPCKVTVLNPNNPATGQPLGYSFVQVQFEVNVPYTKPDGTTGTYTLPPLILPKAEGQWIRSPTQVGDLGVTQAVDTSHGGVTGMSPGVSSLGTAYGNLSSLVFVPIPNTNFGPPPDPNKAWVNGPAGAVLSDAAQTAVVTAAKDLITIAALSGTVQLQGSGTAAGDGIVRQSDLQSALNAFASAIQTWGAAHFQTGTSTPPAPSAPTAAGSSKSFTA